jgi:hypothetical protein
MAGERHGHLGIRPVDDNGNKPADFADLTGLKKIGTRNFALRA